MYKRMLVPLDGSQAAEVAFPFAKALAGRLGIAVSLLHISNPALKEYQPMIKAYVDQAADIIRSGAVKVQRQLYPTVEPKPPEVKGALVIGYPPDEILRYADEKAVDLILVAAHGRSTSKRWAIGSVADKVLRAAKVPVLLVPGAAIQQPPFDRLPTRTLIVPLDGSELAESVLPHVESLAGEQSRGIVEVVLVRACEPPAMPTYYSPELSEIPLHWAQYAQQETARCKQVSTDYLAGVERKLRSNGINVRSEVLVGKASDEIVSYANKIPDGIVVMATHGRSGLSRLVYGSVALNILVGVSNPILLVKPTASTSKTPTKQA